MEDHAENCPVGGLKFCTTTRDHTRTSEDTKRAPI